MSTIKTEAEALRRNVCILELLADRKTYGYRQIVGLANDKCGVKSNRTVSKALNWGINRGVLTSLQRGVYVMTREGPSYLTEERKKVKNMSQCCDRANRLVEVPDRRKHSETFSYGHMSAVVAFEGSEPSIREVLGGRRRHELDRATHEYVDKVRMLTPEGIGRLRLRIEGPVSSGDVSSAANLDRIGHRKDAKKSIGKKS